MNADAILHQTSANTSQIVLWVNENAACVTLWPMLLIQKKKKSFEPALVKSRRLHNSPAHLSGCWFIKFFGGNFSVIVGIDFSFFLIFLIFFHFRFCQPQKRRRRITPTLSCSLLRVLSQVLLQIVWHGHLLFIRELLEAVRLF